MADLFSLRAPFSFFLLIFIERARGTRERERSLFAHFSTCARESL